MRFELTTLTLARLCSTPELRPHPRSLIIGWVIPCKSQTAFRIANLGGLIAKPDRRRAP
jgi:hypothetical protein